MVDVNMSEFPLGLQANDFPRQLLDIEFCGTNLSVLPDDLDQKWPSDGLVVIERSLFTSIPETLTRLSFQYLSMAQNRITELPVAAVEPGYHWSVVQQQPRSKAARTVFDLRGPGLAGSETLPAGSAFVLGGRCIL